jgi:outer membrane lipoprotein SlyB
MEAPMQTLKLALASVSLLASAAVLTTPALAACNNCGTVVEVRNVEKKGEASGGGAVLGGVVGGVLGHQIGSGRGNTAATVAGAAGGAYVGHQVEKNRNATTEYQVIVNMEVGKDRTFTFKNPPRFKSGDQVRIIDGKLTLAN